MSERKTSVIKVHLDTDLGGDIDDICALTMLLNWPQVELIGVTVVGDTSGKRTAYTKYALQLAGRPDIPVAQGAENSPEYYRYDLALPNEENYWPVPIHPAPNHSHQALELLKKSVEQGATIIGIGPFTNLYLLDSRHPGILKQANIVLMGGYIYPPRPGFPVWKNEDDFNIQVDVRSAKHVLEHSQPTLIPLSLTAETYLRRADLHQLHESGPLARLIARQAEAFAQDEKMGSRYGQTCAALPNDIVNFLHDPLACAIAVGWTPAVIKEIPLRIDIQDGWLTETVDQTGRPIKVLTETNGQRFSEYWLKIVSGK